MRSVAYTHLDVYKRQPHSSGRDATPSRGGSHLLEGITDGVGDFLGGILKNFSLDRFDTGDILLVLIILFLLVEGDDLELVITCLLYTSRCV